MKIENQTRYDGRDIRGLFYACAKRWGTKVGKYTITIAYYAPRADGRYVTARGRTLKIIRPRRFNLSAVEQLGGIADGVGVAMPEAAFIDLCSIIEWYVWGMPKKCTWYRGVPPWAEGWRVRIRPLPTKPEKLTGAAYQEAEIAKAETRIAGWEQKQRRATAAIKKLRREIRERRGRIKRLQKDSQR